MTIVYVTHYSNRESGPAFKKLCDICSENNNFADKLLDHNTIDLAAYAEMLTLLGPIIAAAKNQFKDNCAALPLRELLNVAEEAFALLVLENCFNHWKWTAEAKLKTHKRSTNLSSSPPMPTLPTQSPATNHNNNPDDDDDTSAELHNSPNNSPSALLQQTASFEDSPLSQSTIGYSSVTCYDSDSMPNEDNDDNYSQVGPGYRYQYSYVRKDNKLGAGPWTKEGMERYNAIVEKVIARRKVRGVFEEHLTNHFKEQQNKHPLLLTKKRKTKAGDVDEDGSPRKVVVIDLFTDADD